MTMPLEATQAETTELADLATTAPSTLRLSVLVEIGLVDRYARVESPLGPLVVAWNGRGVSTVDIAADDAAFEARHLATTGRRAIRGELPARLGERHRPPARR